MSTNSYLVLDIGGTNLRCGWFDPVSGALTGITRQAVENFHRMPGASVHDVQQAVLRQLDTLIAARLREAPGARPAVCISFAGPVTPDGVVTDAPTIWGATGAPLALGALLEHRLDVPVHVINDVSAAAWRYASAIDEPFCLITVSSGVGNKVLYGGQILVNRYGYGGEIGHQRVDHAPDALPCDCGGRGHLGALASGRGAVAVATRMAQAEPAAFAASLLGHLCEGRVEAISAPHIAAAVQRADPFAERCVKHGIGYMAHSIGAMYAAIGVRRYLFMGGFAQALAPHYTRLVGEALIETGMFGMAAADIPAMLSMAGDDDDHGLAGAGRYLEALLAPSNNHGE